jgi:hypothetical protein
VAMERESDSKIVRVTWQRRQLHDSKEHKHELWLRKKGYTFRNVEAITQSPMSLFGAN